MRRALVLYAGLLGVGILGKAAAAHADDSTADLEGLLGESVVTTASSTAETGSTAPATSTVLTAEDMRKYGMRTIAEAVNFLSRGAVGGAALDTEELGARGVLLARDNNTHFLVLVDGHKLNEPYLGGADLGRGMIPLELVDHVEVVVGPGSVLYGSNAMLGVIHVITKRAKDYRGVHVGVESELLTSIRPWAGVGHAFSLFGTAIKCT